jgi:hypothetical protein
MTLDIYTCDAVLFQSITNSDLYILGASKDRTLIIEIPKDIISIYDADVISIGSKVFQPHPQNNPENNLYITNIEWQDINEPLKLSILRGDNLCLKCFEPAIKSIWGRYDPSIQLFHDSTWRSIQSKDIRPNLYSVTPMIIQRMDNLPIMDLSIYLAAINCILLNEVRQLDLNDWYYIKNNLMTIRDKKGLALFFQDCIEDLLILCDRKILDRILELRCSLDMSPEEIMGFINDNEFI